MTTEQGRGFAVGDLHRPAFYVAIVGALAAYAALMRDLLPLVVTAWVVDVGPHRLHDLNFFGLVWIAILGLAVQLYRPTDRVTAAVVPLIVMGPLAVMAATTGSPITTMPVLFAAIGLLVVALHPAGRSLLRVGRIEDPDRLSAGLLGVAAVPLLAYAGDQLIKQYAIADEHAALVHYGGMALVAVFVLLAGVLSVLRRRDWRFPAWSAGALAVYLGSSSIVFPGMSSSAGPAWGGLAVAWGLAFVAAVETGRGGPRAHVESAIEIDAPIETVWEVTTDPASFVEAIDWVYEARWEEGNSPGEGAVYVERAKPGLTEGTYRWEITAYEPPRRIVHAHESGELDAELEVQLDPIDDVTTRYTQVMRFRSLPAFRPLGYVLERTVVKRAMQRDFDEMILPNYKRLAEERAENP